MHCLVTGGAGFIGSHLADALLAHGHRVVVVDTLATGRRENVPAHARFFRESAGQLNSCQSWDWIFHCAATVGVERVAQHPDHVLADAWIAGEMAVIAQSVGARFLFTSSSEVYDLQPDHTPRWDYAIAKRMAEALITQRCPDALIARLFNTVGPRQRPDYGMVLPRFVQAALSGCPLPRVGDGTQRRAYLHVHDTVAGILALMRAPGGAYDIGGDTPIAVNQLGALVGGCLDRPITWQDLPPRAHDVLDRRLANTAPLRALGWAPTKSLEDAIREAAQ